MMEPESAPAGPEEEPGTEEARQEDAAPEDAPAPPPAAEQPAPAVPEADQAPAPSPSVPPPPPDTPRWAESAALTEIRTPPAPPVEAAPPVEPDPPVEAVPETPVAFEAPPAPPAEHVPVAPVAFETPPAPPAEPAVAAPVAFETPAEPEAPVVDPMFARAQQAPNAEVPDQGWGVAQPPPFAPEASEAPAESASAPPPPPAAAAPFGEPAAAPAPTEATEPGVAEPTDPVDVLGAAGEPEPEPEASSEAPQPPAPVIPVDLDGLWVAGRGRGGSGAAKAPKEKGARGGLRLRRSNDAGLEVAGETPPVQDAPVAADDPAVPGGVADAEAPKKRGAFGKEIRFGRKKKKKEQEEAGPEGGFPVAAPAPEASQAQADPVSDGGFGAVAPPPPPAPGLDPVPQEGGDQTAGLGTDAGFGADSGFGGSSGFGQPAPDPEGWREPAPGKKKRSLRLPSTSGGKFGRPTLIVIVVAALLAAALGYMFLGRGGGASQPAYALDFAAGQNYQYRMTMALNGQMTLSGRNVPLQETLGATMSWDVRSVDGSGVATVGVSLSDAHITVNGKQIPVGDFPEASSHYTMRVGSDGSILSGGGFGAMTGGGSVPTGEVPGTDQLTPLLPGHDVRPGDKWDKTFDSDLPYGMGHVHYVTHSTYVRDEDVNGAATSVIESKMSLPLHMRVDLEQMMKAMGSSTAGFPSGSHPVILYGGHVNGTTTGWFDPSSREMVKTSVDAQFRMAMTFRGLPAGLFPVGNEMLFRGGIIVNLQKV